MPSKKDSWQDSFPLPDDETIRKKVLAELKGNRELFYPVNEDIEFPVLVRPADSGTAAHSLAPVTTMLLQELHTLGDDEFSTACADAIAHDVQAISVSQSQLGLLKKSGHRFNTVIFYGSHSQNDSVPCDRLLLANGDNMDVFKSVEQPGTVWPVMVNAAIWREEGAGLTTQLALALAAGHEQLLNLPEMPGNESSASMIHFRLGTGSTFLHEMASLRAFRLLWQEIAEAYDCSGTTMITATPSTSLLGTSDKYSNLLRLTTQYLGAMCGGADLVNAVPYNLSLDLYDANAFRLSRNIMHILKHEAYMDHFKDPARGAWYIEKLTQTIMEQAWQGFLQIENAGGFTAWESSGKLQEQLQHEKNERKDRVMVGENKYQVPVTSE